MNNISIYPPDNETQTPIFERKNCAIRRGRVLFSPMVEEGQPLAEETITHSFSEESFLGSGEISASVKPVQKFKR